MAKTVKIPLKEIAEKAANKEISGYKVAVKPTIQYEGGDGIKISFSDNSKLTSLSFTSAFNYAIPNVTSMHSMFDSCRSLVSVDLSNLDTSKVTDMGYMFYNCRALTSINLSSFDTSKVTNMGYMFSGCSALTSLNLSSFDTSNVTNMERIFQNCYELTSIPLLDTRKVTNISVAFNGCYVLKSIPSIDVSNVTEAYSTFGYCYSLEEIHMTGMKVDFDIHDSTKFTRDALLEIINNCQDLTGQTSRRITMGSTNLAKLTDEDKLIATNKNWTLA